MTINHCEDITTEIWWQVTSTKNFDVCRNDKFNIPMNGVKLQTVEARSNKNSRKFNSTYTCRADQVVGMGLGTGVMVMGHTADHHHRGALKHGNIVNQAAPADKRNWENGDELRRRQTETLTI